jgi:hypothetical protein
MRRVVKLNERDLSRIVRRVMNEGVPIDAPQTLDANWVGANNGMSGTWKIEAGYLTMYLGDKKVAVMKSV